jgi:uncharacterized membrane protein YhfC
MLYVTYPINFLLMIGVPVVLWFWLVLRWKLSWKLVLWGAIMFLASQFLRLPLLFLLTDLFRNGTLPQPPEWMGPWFNFVFLSFSAGLFEETARWVGYRWFVKDARSWREGVTYGAGHGGIEAVLVGLSVAAVFAQFVALQNVAVSALPVPAEQQAVLAKQIADFWAAPWPLTLLGALERVFALGLHITLSVMVLQAFTRGNIGWLFAAMGWHGLANLVGVGLNQAYGPVAAEVGIGTVAALSLLILFRLRGGPNGQAEAAK